MLPHDRYNVLLEFAHVHVDFHRPELDSVLSMHDIVIGRDCTEIPLPLVGVVEGDREHGRRRKADEAPQEEEEKEAKEWKEKQVQLDLVHAK